MTSRRNIGILAHIDAGKTTVTEHLLHLGGLIRRPGSVDAGTTVTDWMVDEQERGITITSAASTFPWAGTQVTLVDTPGHVDFTIEVERTLRVLDGTVLVISGPDGVQAQTETVWAQRARARLPAIGLINKLDGAAFAVEALLREIEARLDVLPVPLQVARREGDAWYLTDVLRDPGAPARRTVWNFGEDGLELDEEPTDELDEVLRLEALDVLVNAVASFDDHYAARALAGEPIPMAEHLGALRRAVKARQVLPLIFGAARHGLGMRRLADTIVTLLPDTSERHLDRFNASGHPLPDDIALASLQTPCAYVFKTEPRRHSRLAFIRVFSGTIQRGTTLIRTPDGARFETIDPVRVTGRDIEPVDVFEPGEIGALIFAAGDRPPRTGDTLGATPLPFTLERIHPPEPVMEVALEAADAEGHGRVMAALGELCEDDPSLRLGVERETGRTLLAGMGELHLEVALERVRRETGARVDAGAPKIRRRHVLAGEGEGEATVLHPAGRARVTVRVRAKSASALGVRGVTLERPDWTGALASGLESAAGVDGAGPRPLLSGDIAVIGVDVSGSDVVPIMLRDAAEWAALRAIEAADPQEVEPWARLVVVAPDAAIGRLVGDLARRRARLKGSESRGAVQILTAEVPVADLIGFASDLRSMTAGRGQFSLTPLGHRPVEARQGTS